MTRDFDRNRRDDRRQGYTDRQFSGRSQGGQQGGGQGGGQGGRPRRESLGALWRKQVKSGENRGNTFHSGELEVGRLLAAIEEKGLHDGDKLSIVVFENTQKREGEKTPDLRIYVSEDRPNTDADRHDDRRDDRRDNGR
jgi:hypothetical protein